MDSQTNETSNWLEKPLAAFLPKLNIETLLVVIVLIAAIITRFYQVDARVMSHDEVNHVVPANSLYKGQGYAYDPVTHGPLQFHLLAFSYFLFGDNDFSSRVPAVLFSIATVAVALIGYRRYLGRSGAIIAGLLILISPYMLFYGRYTRNEAFGGLWTVVMILGALRYLEKGDRTSLYLLTVVMALHATDKATSFIYNAQMMIFMGLVFLDAALKLQWPESGSRNRFLYLMLGAVGTLGAALGTAALSATNDEAIAAGQAEGAVQAGLSGVRLLELGLLAVAVACVLAALVLLVRNLGWKTIRQQRSFDLIILAGTLTLPQLAAFPMRMIGWNPLDYSTTGMFRTSLFLGVFVAAAVLLGLWWRPRFWLSAAAIYYSIFTVFFTTFFTNGKGFFMGLIAALGYWLSQQGVQRGSQPLYYYALVQIPIYEYLAALGLIAAVVIAVRHRLFTQVPEVAPADQPEQIDASENVTLPIATAQSMEETAQDELGAGAVHGEEPVGELHLPGWLRSTLAGKEEPPAVAQEAPQRVPVMALLLYWSFTALAAYSLAGEKMPWLTVHITAAMLLGAGWGLGYLVDTTPWKDLARRRGLLAALVLVVFVVSLAGLVSALLGSTAPFAGSTLEALTATSNFIMSLVGVTASAVGLFYILKEWSTAQVLRLITLGLFGLGAVLTARTAFTAAYINYDLPVEFLVYAHAARGPKDILAQIEEISKRTTRGNDIVVAYDNESNYPYWWYFRSYPNKRYYGDKPTRDIRDAAVILVGDPNYSKVEPIVKDSFVMFEYMRLWWPMQDYFNLTPERIWNAIVDPKMRQAIFNIWLNRDYSLYAQLTGSTSLSLTTWSPAARIRMYVRKDIAAQMWNYGQAPAAASSGTSDPYEKGMVKLAADRAIGSSGANAGQFNAPRGVAVAKDGSLYIADSRNNRIQHLAADGSVLQVWGTFGDVMKGQAPGGTFSEPWGVAVGPDGSVYVADTWNHRVQKFSADGKFLQMWGTFGQGEKPEAFWGPRAIAIDARGRVFVMDTGNKRIVIFGPNGEPLASFGTTGMDLGQFDEPVGMAFDRQGLLYVADTWNQRIQVFQSDASGTNFLPATSWNVSAWFGQSLDNKPFLVVDAGGTVYVTDPDAGRVLQFSAAGQFLRGWSDLAGEIPVLNQPSGLAVDNQGGLWVSDAISNRLVHFNLAQQPVQALPAQPQLVAPSPTPTK